MSVFRIVQGDQLPVLYSTLTHVDGSVVDLTTATEVAFTVRSPGDTEVLLSEDADIVIANEGSVAYSFAEGETDNPGNYLGAFVVTWGTGETQTYPTQGYVEVVILPSLTAVDPDTVLLSPSGVYNRTNTIVSEDKINLATYYIGDLIDRDLLGDDYDAMSDADQRRILSAISYQAAWMQSQPDLFARFDLTNISVPGLSMAFSNDDAALLAPLANRVLNKLSWLQTQTIRLSPYLSYAVGDRMPTSSTAFGIQPIQRNPLSDENYWE